MSSRPASSESNLVRALRGEAVRPAPVWFMRQAGRYLPEYRALRTQAPSFLEFCYTPALAIEATLQPMRRFAFDASIVFSDILVVPDALGQRVWFVEGEGPRLEPIADAGGLRLDGLEERLTAVYAAVRGVRDALPPAIGLYGFCGAPWTLATYMVAGRGGDGRSEALAFAKAAPEAFDGIVDVLVDACARHLVAQVRAGADAVQIFDSWAGLLDDDGFARWCVGPTRRLVAAVKAATDAPIVGFPRGVGDRYAAYVDGTGVDAVSLDQGVPLGAARELQRRVCVQGNLDPALVVSGGDALDAAVDAICASLGDGPLVFNLGHGITPDADPANVPRVIARVKARTA